MIRTILFLPFCLVALFSRTQLASTPQNISPLLIGERLPESTLFTPTGDSVGIYSLLKEKPSVVIFYRGGWCPYCTRHLSAIGEVETEILKLGFQIIAVTGQMPIDVANTLAKYPVNYTLLSDPQSTWIKAIGIGFQPNERTFGYMQQNSQGKVEEVLPVPTILVIDTQGEILFEHINPNYSKRMEPQYLLKVLEGLKEK